MQETNSYLDKHEVLKNSLEVAGAAAAIGLTFVAGKRLGVFETIGSLGKSQKSLSTVVEGLKAEKALLVKIDTDVPVTAPEWQTAANRAIGLEVPTAVPETRMRSLTILHPRFRDPKTEFLSDRRKVDGIYGNPEFGNGFFQRIDLPVTNTRAYFKDVGAVVKIVAQEEKPFSGSGVILDKSGVVATAAHVAQSLSKELQIYLRNGQSFTARVAAIDKNLDLAVLRSVDRNLIQELDLHTATIGPLNDVRAYSRVALVGHPLGLNDLYASLGHYIGAAKLSLPDFAPSRTRAIFQINSAMKGYSGGPIFDQHGRVIAINSWIWDKISIGEAVVRPGSVGAPASNLLRMMRRAQ
ncbi:MAG TPA: serine protease [Oculatellaceae cyanobacterium]